MYKGSFSPYGEHCCYDQDALPEFSYSTVTAYYRQIKQWTQCRKLLMGSAWIGSWHVSRNSESLLLSKLFQNYLPPEV